MQQRISITFHYWIQWMKDGGNAGMYGTGDFSPPPQTVIGSNLSSGGGNPFHPPCSTRYYETDIASICRAQWSVQQCCAYAVKPYKPTNFIKLRTQYGPRQALQDPKNGMHPLVEKHFMDITALGSYQADLAYDEKLQQLLQQNQDIFTPQDAV